MPFVLVEFLAGAADAERWADALLDAGALGIDTADPHAGSDRETPRYGEPHTGFETDPAAVELWPVCRVSAMFAHDTRERNAGRRSARAHRRRSGR